MTMLMGTDSVTTDETKGTGTDAAGNAVIDERLQKFLATLTIKKVHHVQLLMEGVCSHCGHCHQPLTESISIERGIGPICSKKGYLEEPRNGDVTDAMIALGEYPQLVEFLVKKYEPGNLRGLMNALVKVCSLNRSNNNLHSACCDAIDSLGYHKLANAMRETVAVVLIKDSKAVPGSYEVRVKNYAFKYAWKRDLLSIPGARVCKTPTLHILVPIHAPGDVTRKVGGNFEGEQMSNKLALWKLMVRHYLGFSAKTPSGGVKILERNRPVSEPPPAP